MGHDEGTEQKPALGSNRNTLTDAGNRDWSFFGETCDDEGRPTKVWLYYARALHQTARQGQRRSEPVRSKPMKPTSKNAKGLTCWRRFRGTRTLRYLWYEQRGNSARQCNTQNHPDHRLAPSLLRPRVMGWFHWCHETRFYFIPSAMTGFIVSVLSVSEKPRLLTGGVRKGLELGEGKTFTPQF